MRHGLRSFGPAALLVLALGGTASAAITYIPTLPNVDQNVAFTLVVTFPVNQPSIQWSFGDGTHEAQKMTVNKTYLASGTYQVNVDYESLGTFPTHYHDTTSITVVEKRSIACSPASPLVGRPVVFQANNFLSSNIRWEFGDGQSLTGGPSAVHTYQAGGTYLVRAWDWEGTHPGQQPITLSLKVTESLGPRAAFQIFFLQLRFKDGKSYTVVKRDDLKLVAFADIKYEGTGTFRARWLVDGQPFRVSTRAMPFAQDATLDSSGAPPGQPSGLPGLPTNLPGPHDVSLEILEPVVGFAIPVIRYFVTAETEEAGQDLAGVRLDIDSVRGAPGVDCRFEPGLLQTPAGRYILLNGRLTYGPQRPPVKLVLLRIHLETELIDQQFLKDLRPGEDRAFGTSILNATAENKWVYITAYNLDGAKAELLFFQKMKLGAPAR